MAIDDGLLRGIVWYSPGYGGLSVYLSVQNQFRISIIIFTTSTHSLFLLAL